MYCTLYLSALKGGEHKVVKLYLISAPGSSKSKEIEMDVENMLISPSPILIFESSGDIHLTTKPIQKSHNSV